MGRLGTPEEVAAVASFLVSVEASYVTLHEVSADAWGYDGRTQAARRTAKL